MLRVNLVIFASDTKIEQAIEAEAQAQAICMHEVHMWDVLGLCPDSLWDVIFFQFE